MNKFLINCIVLTLFIVAYSTVTIAQFVEGIEHYKNGEYKEAVKKFENAAKENKSNALNWNFLGLALEKTGDLKGARKALKKAVSLQPNNAVFHSNLAFVFLQQRKYKDAKRSADKAIKLDNKNADAFYFRSSASFARNDINDALADSRQAILLDEKLAAAYFLESDIRMTIIGKEWSGDSWKEMLSKLRESITSLERCLKVCDPDPAITPRLEDYRAFYDYFEKKIAEDKDAPNVPKSSEEGGLEVTYKPRPGYTESARQKNVVGSVRLAVMFRSDGTIGPIIVLQGLPEGLTDQAMKAAKSIAFKPEVRDGLPVTVVKTVVFNFIIY